MCICKNILYCSKPQEKDLFLSCQSELKYYCQDALQTWTGTEHIAKCARNYRLNGAPFEYLCEHNAKVCIAANKQQVAESWRLLSLVVKDPLELFLNAEPALPATSKYFPGVGPNDSHRFNIDDHRVNDEKEAKADTMKLRRVSGNR